MAEKTSGIKILSDNRSAGHNYFLLDRFEAGKLGAAFGPSPAVTPEVAAVAEREEGWVLGA